MLSLGNKFHKKNVWPKDKWSIQIPYAVVLFPFVTEAGMGSAVAVMWRMDNYTVIKSHSIRGILVRKKYRLN